MTKGNLRIVIIALSVLVFFGGLYILKTLLGNKSEDNNVESSNQQENEVKDNYYYKPLIICQLEDILH